MKKLCYFYRPSYFLCTSEWKYTSNTVLLHFKMCTMAAEQQQQKILMLSEKKNKNGHLFPVLCRPLQAQSDIATNGHNRRWEWTNPSRASSSAMRLHRESLLVGADTIRCSPNGEPLTWRKDVLIRSPVE